MNENDTPAPLPPTPPERPFAATRPRGNPPIDRFSLAPLEGPCHPFAVLGELLKRPGCILYELKVGRFGSVFGALLLIALFSLGVYGLVAGSLTGGNQLWLAPVKIIVGTALCVLICLPSLYIFLCLSGVDAHVREVAGELMASVCLTALLLIGFAPVAWVFSQSTDSIPLMGFLHLLFWSVALWFGLRLVGRSSPGTGGSGLSVWIIIYVVVSLQMMTSLRPIIGHATTVLPTEKQFFIPHLLGDLSSASSNSSTP
ncbi:hypothetical protein BH09VER1_BH09VER1_01670 [soil metagenome]